MDNILEEEKARFCLKELRKLIEDETNLECPTDDAFLVRFVRAKKYNTEVAFRNLKMYYGIRLKHPRCFERLYPSELRHVLNCGAVRVLRYRDEMKRQIFVFRVGHWDAYCTSFEDMTLACMLVAEEMTFCTESQKVGAQVVVDHMGLNMGHARQLSVASFRKLLQIFQDCFPARYRAIHLVNQPFLFDILFSLAKKFMTNKLLSKIHFHTDYQSLHKFISPKILPESFGGTLNEEESWDDELICRLYTRDKFYKDMLQYGYKTT